MAHMKLPNPTGNPEPRGKGKTNKTNGMKREGGGGGGREGGIIRQRNIGS